ncbi:MAG: endonuclease/exonuclease/phosphatase family protein [Candidatus Sericytochromatia bacterium]|nr:endonuclease/exonuclease/phosphatase family protein [Candidatus Sericytochromatia bacterium]
MKNIKKTLTSLLSLGLMAASPAACGTPQAMPMAQFNRFAASQPQMMMAQNRMRGFSDTAAASTKLRIASYNIRNLFDGVPMPGGSAEKAKPEKELVALGEAMRHINADVIALQEVENKEVLAQFRDRYIRELGYREMVLVEANDPRGIDVALISRYPVVDVKSHKDVRFPVPGQQEQQGFSRDLLQVRVQGPNNYLFTAFVVHLKSQHGAEVADAKRFAEADQINRIVRRFQEQNPKENVVVLGDFNDVVDAAEIASVVNTRISGLGLYDIIHEEFGVQPWVFTYHPQKYRSRIDYILLNQNMKNEYIPRSVQLYKPRKEGEQWQQLYFYDASDHIPITIDLDISQDR